MFPYVLTYSAKMFASGSNRHCEDDCRLLTALHVQIMNTQTAAFDHWTAE